MPARPEWPEPRGSRLVVALQKRSLRWGMAVAAVLLLVGFALPLVVPAGQGWISLLAQGKNPLWAFALFVLAVTGYSAIRRWSDGRLFDSDLNLTDLSWEEFEGYLAEFYRRLGVSVTYRGGAGADGGVDLVLEDATGRRILQAKHWKATSVGVVPLRALWGVRDDEHAQGAVFVTSGVFTRDAIRFAEGKRLELVDGIELRRWIAQVKAASAVASPSIATPVAAGKPCPKCGDGILVERLARRGAKAGSHFWGCSRWPECKYTTDT